LVKFASRQTFLVVATIADPGQSRQQRCPLKVRTQERSRCVRDTRNLVGCLPIELSRDLGLRTVVRAIVKSTRISLPRYLVFSWNENRSAPASGPRAAFTTNGIRLSSLNLLESG
jgi:hypothetical protein